MQAQRYEPWIFRALLLCFIVYSLGFILKTSFILVGERNFALFDDAMISMTYARNLAQGHGLVWYPGAQPLEGFTNLLWVLVMAGVHLLPIPEAKLSLAMQLLGLLCLLANLTLVRRLALRFSGGSSIAAISSVFLTAFYYPMNSWALQGMEVGAFALLLTGAVALSVRGLTQARPSYGAYALLGVATLLRLDGVIPLLLTASFLCWTDRPNAKRHALLAVAVLVVFVGGQTLFRLAYFGHALPNTYFLKLSGFPSGPRVLRGVSAFTDFALRFNPLLLVVPLGLAVWRRRRGELLLALLFLGQCAYSVYVGGDAWEQWSGANRFLCTAIPLLFVLLGLAIAHAVSLVRTWTRGRVTGTLAALVTAVVLAGVTAQINWGKATPGLKALLLVAEPTEVHGTAYAAVQGRLIRTITAEDASIAVVWAGNPPYFAHRRGVDLLGRCDARIAHGPIGMSQQDVRAIGFYPGHMKWDYAYSIGEQKPDVICHLWGFPDPTLYTGLEKIPPDASPFVEGRYVHADLGGYKFLLLRDSDRIDWIKVRPFLVAD
jgi:hypothetical protein